MYHRIKKGQHIPLNVTQKAQHRIFIGLSWDPNTKVSLRSKITEKLQWKKSDHDLDLTALLYDEERKLLNSISAKNGEHVDSSGKIYHSGDNTKGIGDGDDEQISVELKNLPTNIHHILFKVSIPSGHSFKEINAPEIHLSDAYSNRKILYTPLNSEEEKEASIFIFFNLYRQINKENSWIIHNINEFFTAKRLKNKENALKSFLLKEER